MTVREATKATTILVTGASGCVGRPTVEGLAQAGFYVRAAARRPFPSTSSYVQPITLDVTANTDILRHAVTGVDAVIHLAARVHEIPHTSAEKEAFWAINADAPRRLADQARRAGVSTLVFASTVAVYGDTDGSQVMDESGTCRPQTLYAQAKYFAEKHWMEAGGTVLRFALVFGPFDRGNVATLLHKVRAGRAMIVGRGDNRKSLVYSENIADRIVLLVSSQGRLPSAVFNVVDSSPTQRELILAIAEAVGRRPPGQLPTVPAFVGGTLLDLLNYARGQRTHWLENLRKLTLNTEFDGCRLDRMLRYKPRVSIKSGLAEVVQSLRLGVTS